MSQKKTLLESNSYDVVQTVANSMYKVGALSPSTANTVEAFGEALNSAHLTSLVSSPSMREFAMSMWMSGKTDNNTKTTQSNVKTANRNKGGKVTDNTSSKVLANHELTPMLEAFAKKIGMDINISDSLNDGERGNFDVQNGVINLSLTADNVMEVLAHEGIGEVMKAYSVTDYNAVKRAVVNYLLDKYGADDTNELKQKYKRAYLQEDENTSSQDALDEIVNDALIGLFISDEGLTQLGAYCKTEGQIKKVGSAIVNFIKTFVARLSNYLQGKGITIQADVISQLSENEQKQLRDQIFKGLDNARENYLRASQKGVNENIVPTNTKGINENIIPVKHSIDIQNTNNISYNERKAMDDAGITNTHLQLVEEDENVLRHRQDDRRRVPGDTRQRVSDRHIVQKNSRGQSRSNSKGTVVSVSRTLTLNDYSDALQKSIDSNVWGLMVDPHTAQELADKNIKCYLSDDGFLNNPPEMVHCSIQCFKKQNYRCV